MRFGRVEGLIERVNSDDESPLHLIVTLDTGQTVRIVRDELVPWLSDTTANSDLTWQVDQYTQETIGVDLATEGWEVIGAGEIPLPIEGEVTRSATYAVRLL